MPGPDCRAPMKGRTGPTDAGWPFCGGPATLARRQKAAYYRDTPRGGRGSRDAGFVPACRGKSGLQGTSTPGNARAEAFAPQGKDVFDGKRNRKQTAGHPQGSPVRVKGWGKSPPRFWQQKRHGKPRTEQIQAAGRVPEWPAGRMHRATGQPVAQTDGPPRQNPAYR